MTSSPTCWSFVSNSICQVREQTGLLLWKTCILFSRQQISIWAQVVTPFLICLYIFMVQQMIDALLLKYVDFDPASENINIIPKCWGVGCVTLGVGYTNGAAEWTTHVLEHVAKHQGLKLGKDIVTLGLVGYEETFRQLSVHPNSTQALVVFCTGEIPVKNPMFSEQLLCSGNGTHHLLLYSIIYNFTTATMPVFIKPDEKSPTDRSILPLKIAIDNGILDYRRSLEGLPPILIEAEISDYPHLSNRFIKGYDTVTMQGPLYFFLPPMIIFIMVMSEMVREKEQHLRQVLNTLGISQVAFWLSWVITGLVFSLVVSNITALAGNVLGVLVLVFFTFTNAMIVVGFFLVTVLSSGKTAYTVSYSLLLAGLVLQGFISSHLLIICMYITDLPTWFLTLRSLIRLYPPYNFATSFYEISRLSSSHPLYTEYRWAPGEGYTWDHFFKRQEGWLEGHQYITPSLSDSLTFMCWDMLFFALLTWICDHVIESNRGVSEPIYFMFTRKYWGIGRNPAKRTALENIEMHEMSGDDVIEEIDKIKFLERNNEVVEGIRIIGLGKTYQKYPCGIASADDVRALRNLYLSAEKDEVLTLLGHNGAGKSTLLSILSGTLAPTHGSAVICGNDISDSMDSIRSHMGFCPQHSWLWDELTAEEHIYFFTRLKGFSVSESRKICEDILHEVELSDVAKARVGTFSGGMRRRMSIALAGIGNPDVILMDEPTTGLDPISRAQVWKLIQHLKRGKVVILTTHSMEEADALSDRIAVLVDGDLKCIGSSLYLKNKYGTGYRVSLVAKDSSTLCQAIKTQVPAAQIMDESADSLLITLPKDDLATMTSFFQSIEDGELSHLVADWGISNTTLEEVFMRLTDTQSLLG